MHRFDLVSSLIRMSEEQVQFPSLTRLRDKAIERKEQALMEEEKNKAEGNTSKRRVRYI